MVTPPSSSTVTVTTYVPADVHPCTVVAAIARGFNAGLGSGSGTTEALFGKKRVSTALSPRSAVTARSSLPGSVAVMASSAPAGGRKADRSARLRRALKGSRVFAPSSPCVAAGDEEVAGARDRLLSLRSGRARPSI
jgi:hypothetical protein